MLTDRWLVQFISHFSTLNIIDLVTDKSSRLFLPARNLEACPRRVMSGLEIVGVVLGAFPLILEGAKGLRSHLKMSKS